MVCDSSPLLGLSPMRTRRQETNLKNIRGEGLRLQNMDGEQC